MSLSRRACFSILGGAIAYSAVAGIAVARGGGGGGHGGHHDGATGQVPCPKPSKKHATTKTTGTACK